MKGSVCTCTCLFAVVETLFTCNLMIYFCYQLLPYYMYLNVLFNHLILDELLLVSNVFD